MRQNFLPYLLIVCFIRSIPEQAVYDDFVILRLNVIYIGDGHHPGDVGNGFNTVDSSLDSLDQLSVPNRGGLPAISD